MFVVVVFLNSWVDDVSTLFVSFVSLKNVDVVLKLLCCSEKLGCNRVCEIPVLVSFNRAVVSANVIECKPVDLTNKASETVKTNTGPDILFSRKLCVRAAVWSTNELYTTS
jgi:hypothetical protein